MLDGARFLSAEQFLLTTLLVKLAVIAVLATMLARYRRFRHILIFERRGWLDRFVFTLSIALPLMAGGTLPKTPRHFRAGPPPQGAPLSPLLSRAHPRAP